MSWQTRLSRNRRSVQAGPPGDPAAPAKPKADAKVAKALAGTLASAKVIAQHGAALAPAAGDMSAIASVVSRLSGYRAKPFTNAVDQFYTALARSLAKAAPEVRTETVGASMAAMRKLVEGMTDDAALVPAIAVLSSLLERRGVPDARPDAHAEAALRTVLDLVEATTGQDGQPSTLFAFRNLVDATEVGASLKASDRPAGWQAVADHLRLVIPRPGAEQGEIGRLVGAAQSALRETKGDVPAAFARARTAAHEQLAPVLGVAGEQVKAGFEGLEAGQPAHAAYTAVSEALLDVLAQNPAGPEGLAGSVEAAQGALRNLAGAATAENVEVFEAIADVIRQAGRTTGVLTALDYVSAHAAQLVGAAGVKAALQSDAAPETVPRRLLAAHLAGAGQAPDGGALAGALEKLERLPPGPGLAAAAVLVPKLNGKYAAELADALFVEARRTPKVQALDGFATRFLAARAGLDAAGVHAARAAGALARSNLQPVDKTLGAGLGKVIGLTLAAYPEAPIDKLLAPGRDGEPGLVTFSRPADFAHDAHPLIQGLFTAAAQAPGKPDTGTLRLALQIAAGMASLDRAPEKTDFPRVLQDFSGALAEPKSLHAAPRTGAAAVVRGAKAAGAASFVAAHLELPVEVALTAGRALDEAQMGWLVGQAASSRSRTFVRVLRDAVFAAVKADRLDFVAALAGTADHKIMAKAAQLAALEHRQNKTDAIPFDRLVEGLNAGEDPVQAIESERALAALAAFRLEDVATPDEAGMALIQRMQPELKKLFGFFDKPQYGQQPEFFLEHLRAVVQGHADGTWPAAKYENDAAKDHLQGLSEEQRGIWAQEMISPMEAPAAAEDPEMMTAVQLLRGVAAELKNHVDLTGPGFEKTEWSEASRDALRTTQAELLTNLRDGKKGTKKHREAAGRIGGVTQRLAVVELALALDQAFEGAVPDPQVLLSGLKPTVEAAVGPLRRLGQPGFAQALQDAAYAVKPTASAPRQGVYACDEDRMDAYLTSFQGSCMNPKDGFNRGSLAELMRGSQYKMGRVMNGDQCLGRTFFRLLRVELPNGYKGYALRMDKPVSPSNWNQTPPDREMKLMYQHGLTKAAAMGIPLMVTEGNHVKPAAEAKGLEVEGMTANIFLHRGVTGMHHNQGMHSGHYFVLWPGVTSGYGKVYPKEEDRETQLDYAMQIVMPPGWAPPEGAKAAEPPG